MIIDEDVSPARAAELVRDGNAQLVDVRTPEEVAAGRIAGALHIELEQLRGQAGQLALGRPFVFDGPWGQGSPLASGAFRAAGFEAYNLDGGLLAWVGDGLPIEPEGGSVAGH